MDKKTITIKYAGNRTFTAPYAIDNLDKISIGDEFDVKLLKSRNIAYHRKFFAVLQMAHENLPEQIAEFLPTVEVMLQDIKIGVGHVDTHVNIATGEAYAVPRSISFPAIDQREFEGFVNMAIAYMIKHYFSGDEQFQAVLALSI